MYNEFGRLNEISRMIAGPNNDLLVMVHYPGSIEIYRAGKPLVLGYVYDKFREVFFKQDGYKLSELYFRFKKTNLNLEKNHFYFLKGIHYNEIKLVS